jgi:hypothetical protein
MAVPLLSQEYVRRQLEERRHCTKLFELGTAGMWMTRKGFHFTVPQEGPDKAMLKAAQAAATPR